MFGIIYNYFMITLFVDLEILCFSGDEPIVNG